MAESLVIDEPANVLDNSKIYDFTGWEPQTSLEDGIKAVYDHVVKVVAIFGSNLR